MPTNKPNEEKDENAPIKKMDISKNPDNKIDQDFPNYPHYPAEKDVINPKNKSDEEVADVDNKDGEKRNIDRRKVDEGKSDGSASAFERTENDSPLNEKDTSPGENY
jgi:hypothetical protein